MDRQNTKMMKLRFSGKTCMPYPTRDLYIRSLKAYKRRTISKRGPRVYHRALEQARARDQTVEFQAERHS